MKTPLRYQITEFDCGSVSLLNCITFLFERIEIPAELIKAISTYTLDCYDELGNMGNEGTSRAAIAYLSQWICDFADKKNFGIKCKYLTCEDVTTEIIRKCVVNGGCVNIRSYLTTEHYVTLTHIDDDFVYLWDPYYMPKDHYKINHEIKIISDNPFSYNRKVPISRFDSQRRMDFALGPINKRECVLFYKK